MMGHPREPICVPPDVASVVSQEAQSGSLRFALKRFDARGSYWRSGGSYRRRVQDGPCRQIGQCGSVGMLVMVSSPFRPGMGLEDLDSVQGGET